MYHGISKLYQGCGMKLNLITVQKGGHMLTKILKNTAGVLAILLLLPLTPIILFILALLQASDMAK